MGVSTPSRAAHRIGGPYVTAKVRAAGGEAKHQPSNWLRMQQTQDLVSHIEVEAIPHFRGIESKQGLGTFVCKELVYAYAMWISRTFCLKAIRAYDQMQTASLTAWRQLQALVAEEVSTQVRNLPSLPQSEIRQLCLRGISKTAPRKTRLKLPPAPSIWGYFWGYFLNRKVIKQVFMRLSGNSIVPFTPRTLLPLSQVGHQTRRKPCSAGFLLSAMSAPEAGDARHRGQQADLIPEMTGRYPYPPDRASAMPFWLCAGTRRPRPAPAGRRSANRPAPPAWRHPAGLHARTRAWR